MQILVYKPASIVDTSQPAWVGFLLHSIDTSNSSDPIVFNISCTQGTLTLPVSATLPACRTDALGVRTCTQRGAQASDQSQIRHISVTGAIAEINQLVGMIGYTPGGAHVDDLSFSASNKANLLPSSAKIELCSCSAVGKCVPTAESYTCVCNAGWSRGKQSKSCEVSHVHVDSTNPKCLEAMHTYKLCMVLLWMQ